MMGLVNNLTADDLSQGEMAKMAGISRECFTRRRECPLESTGLYSLGIWKSDLVRDI